MDSERDVRDALSKHGQEHLLRFWDELNGTEREALLADIRGIDLDESIRFFRRITGGQVESERENADGHGKIVLEPVPPELHASVSRSKASELESYEVDGLRQIANGHVGVLLLAGGQGTRLGVTYPKGMFNVGLPSQKSLIQLQAERIKRLQMLAEEKFSKPCVIPWYIMTSSATMGKTEEFFQKHNYFGLDKANVVMFEQGMLPCFDFEGKVLLEDKGKIAKSPDGNGGLYKALKKNKILDDMDRKNVKYLHAYCVDNILVKVADPVFIGYCLSKGADCAAKVVRKVSPTEPIGIVCKVNGKLEVVEYSEITQEDAERRNADNELTFNAGNICNHFFTSEFLKSIATQFESEMKVHKAVKKIPHIDSVGNKIKPVKPNGVKIEKFVFDVFPFASNFVIWEVLRDEEFSALKNSVDSDKDNPVTARDSLLKLHKKYIERAGGLVTSECEISPLVSYAGESLQCVKGKEWTGELTLEMVSGQNGFH